MERPHRAVARRRRRARRPLSIPPLLVADTNVVSFLSKDPGHPNALRYRPVVEGHTLMISFMTLAEMWRGAELDGWGERRRTELRAYLELYVVDAFDPSLCEAWAWLLGLSKRGGHNLSHADAWIAATAITRDVPLVSDNVRHFEWIPGLRLLTTQ